MRRRSLLAMGAAGGAAAALGAGTPAWAAPSGPRLAARPSSGQQGEPDSLRALAAKIGLRFGTALIPQDIETPSYAAIAGSQFSVVTPGNGMKWQIVEPTQGSYDWSQADQLVAFARANRQLIRGPHAAVAQPAARLAHRRRRQRHHHRPAAAGAASPAHHDRGHAVPREDMAVGRRQRILPRQRPVRYRPEQLLDCRPRARHHSAGIPVGARGGPGRAALLQRLQHRRRGRHERQERRRLRMAQGAARRGRADHGHREPGAPGHPVRVLRRALPAGPGAVRQRRA